MSPTHPVGRFKAEFFLSLGYSTENWRALEADLQSLLENEVHRTETTDFGEKYEIRGMIKGPSGRSAEIVTALIVLNSEDFPRFITAYPGGD